jgi:Ca-activated chloride channel family protein
MMMGLCTNAKYLIGLHDLSERKSKNHQLLTESSSFLHTDIVHCTRNQQHSIMKTLARILYFVTVYTALFFAQRVFALETSEDKTLAPYLQVNTSRDTSGEVMPLKNTVVNARIDGIIAHVTVEQTYANTGNETIHAEYVFPGSTRAAVHGMTMKIGERITRAVIREKQQAQQEFAKAKIENKAASLLEQQRPNVFQMSLANILPGEQVTITLEYSESIIPEQGLYQWVFPTVVGPRYTHGGQDPQNSSNQQPWSANPHLSAGEAPVSNFSLNLQIRSSLDLAELQCLNHKGAIDWKSKQQASFQLRSAEDANRDVIVVWRLSKNQIDSGILLHHGEKENTFLLQIEAPARVVKDQINPRDYHFVVDVSGSMLGFPLDTSYQLMRKLLGSLNANDSFSISLFAGNSQTFAESPTPATHENIEKAIRWMERAPSGGSTELVQALRRAYAPLSRRDDDDARSRSMIVITDGYINFETEAFHLIRENLHLCNLYAFGIGGSVNRHLIEGMAACGQGEPFIVTQPGEAEAVVKRFVAYSTSPVLSNITLRAEDNEIIDAEPASVRDLFAERPIAITGKLRHHQQGKLILSGMQADGSRYEKIVDLKEVPAERQNIPALPILWARERVRHLGDYQSLGLPTTEIRDEILDLGLKYSLLTEYTSFLAIDETPRTLAENNADSKKTERQVLPMPAGVSNSAASGFSKGSSVPEPSTTSLLALLLAMLCLHRKR